VPGHVVVLNQLPRVPPAKKLFADHPFARRRISRGDQLIPGPEAVLVGIHEARGVGMQGRATDFIVGCVGKRRVPFANLRQSIRDSSFVRTHQARNALIVVCEIADKDAGLAPNSPALDLVLQIGPGRETVFAREDQLRVMQRKRSTSQLLRRSAAQPRVMIAHASERREIA
jgi:hypothetical protein